MFGAPIGPWRKNPVSWPAPEENRLRTGWAGFGPSRPAGVRPLDRFSPKNDFYLRGVQARPGFAVALISGRGHSWASPPVAGNRVGHHPPTERFVAHEAGDEKAIFFAVS